MDGKIDLRAKEKSIEDNITVLGLSQEDTELYAIFSDLRTLLLC